LFLDSFFELIDERQYFEATPLPISWFTITYYCEVHNLTGEAYEDMLYFVKALDDAYLKHLRGKAKNGNLGKTGKSSGRKAGKT
jgi:hypothetical protein